MTRVLVLSSGDATLDARVATVLQAQGHFPTIGPAYTLFANEGNALAGFDVVYLQANANWQAGNMPAAGQNAINTFVQSGGGLLTSAGSSGKTPGAATSGSSSPSSLPSRRSIRAAPCHRLPSRHRRPHHERRAPADLPHRAQRFHRLREQVHAPAGPPSSSTGPTPSPTAPASWASHAARDASSTSRYAPAPPAAPRHVGNAVNWLNPHFFPCVADFNADGFVSSQDFFDYISAFFASSPTADFNHHRARQHPGLLRLPRRVLHRLLNLN